MLQFPVEENVMISIALMYLSACNSEKAVTIFNNPPEVNIISHNDGDEVFEGYPVEFQAVLSDVNHDIDQLTARWKVDGEEVCPFLPPDQSGESVCVAMIQDGDEEITVEVRDPENASGEDSIVLDITPTAVPTAVILKPVESGLFYSDYPITFEGLIFDNEDNVTDLFYEWSSSIDGVIELNSTLESDGSMLGSVYLSEGIHFITLRVEDTTAKTSTASTTITVGGPNNDPNCGIVAPTNGFAVPVGDIITFEGFATDEDINNNQLTVEWTSDKIEGGVGTSTPNTSGEFVFSYSGLTVDTHSVTMTVTDEKGSTCSDFVIVTIGTPPIVTIDSPSSGTYNEGDLITFSATVSDNEDQPNEISLEWTSSDGTVLNSQSTTSNGNVEFILNDMPYGQHVITLTGTDTDGLTASDLVSFGINALPTQPSLTVLPENPNTEDDITATASGSTDADGGSVTYTYEWIYGSTTVSGSTLSSSSTEKGQIWTVVATPNDGTANGPSVSQSVTIGNTSPTDLVVSITPSSGVYNNSELTCSATANDVDSSDTLEYSYEWSTGQTTDAITLDASLNPMDSVTCTVTATDGTDSVSNSESVTLENRSPVLSNLIIETDGDLWNGTTLTCSAEVTDEDGESPQIVYTWSLPNASSIEGETYTLENVSDGDIFTCTASVEDGYGGTDTVSDSVTTATTNTPPVVDSAGLSPAIVYTNDTITATASFVDSNSSQTVTGNYAWFVVDFDTGITTEVQTGSDNTLSGIIHFDRDDEVYVVVTPNDGVEDGNSFSLQTLAITVSNSEPTQPSVQISPSNPNVGVDDLTCTVSGSTDDDGDGVEYFYEWIGPDGSIEQSTGPVSEVFDIFLGTGTTAGSWTCQVTPTDGFDDGVNGSTTIVIQSSVESSLSRVYWTENGSSTLKRSQPDGSNIETIASGESYPIGIALDPISQKVYWSNYTSNTIRYADLDGSNPSDLLTTGDFPAAMDIDTDTGKIYWTETSGSIKRADLDGSNVETIHSGVSFSVGLVLDADKIYWSSETDSTIMRSDLNGGNTESVVSSNIDMPRGMDVAGGYVYWAERGTQSIKRRLVNGGSVETIAYGFSFIQDVKIDISNQEMYFIDSLNSHALYKSNLDGSNRVQIATPNEGKHIALYEEAVVEEEEDGECVDGLFWPYEDTTLNAPCLDQYYQHADAVAACQAKGSEWFLPSISQASSYLATLSPSEQQNLFPLSGNGGGGVCAQTQTGLNGLWWLSDHNGQSGGSSIFCNTSTCYTTGTTMGDIYFYRARCIRVCQ
jgi:hypothetical protein